MSHRCDRILKAAPVMAARVGRALAPERHKHLWSFWTAPRPWGVQEPRAVEPAEAGAVPASWPFLWEKVQPGLPTLGTAQRLSLSVVLTCWVWLSQISLVLQGIPSWPAPPCLSLCKKEFQIGTCCVRSPVKHHLWVLKHWQVWIKRILALVQAESCAHLQHQYPVQSPNSWNVCVTVTYMWRAKHVSK